MKGFIELTVHHERFLIALNAIAGIWDHPEGCHISLQVPIVGLTGHNTTAALSYSYDEMISLIKAAQL